MIMLILLLIRMIATIAGPQGAGDRHREALRPAGRDAVEATTISSSSSRSSI